MTWSLEAETHTRAAGRLFEVLAIAEDRPEYHAMAGVLFGAACRLRDDRLEVVR
jgi:hypothetical protein